MKSSMYYRNTTISEKSDSKKPFYNTKLCQELCEKLNLSDSSEISEIIRILSLNVPHLIREQYLNKDILTTGLNIEKHLCT